MSPNLISLVVIVSFSLITGTIFASINLAIVALAFKCFLLVSVSSGESKIWAHFKLNFSSAAFQEYASSIWPIAAAAWFSSKFKVLISAPKEFLPKAIAPELTMIIFLFFDFNFLISFAKLENHLFLIFLFD